jgi:hypothetical protein
MTALMCLQHIAHTGGTFAAAGFETQVAAQFPYAGVAQADGLLQLLFVDRVTDTDVHTLITPVQ